MKVNQTWIQVLGGLCMELTPSITNQHILFCYLLLLCKHLFISLLLAAPHGRRDLTWVGTWVPCGGSPCMHAKLLQSCPTLCNSMNCSLPGSSVHGILQARILSGLPFPPPGDLPDPGIEPASPEAPALQADSYCWTTTEALQWKYRVLTTGPPGKSQQALYMP